MKLALYVGAAAFALGALGAFGGAGMVWFLATNNLIQPPF